LNVLLLTLIAAHTTVGVATQYTEAEHLGNPLYCDQGNGLVYDRSIGPWVAMPHELFESGAVLCGDLIQVRIIGASDVWANAYDAGELSTRTFRGGLPVVVDVPEYWATWDWACPEATVVNWSAVARECKERGWCD